ncbi:hypothetical protein [Teredinibacter turnerae]|uniref:hypothetical protein n=1 Tax=Teredinibacter turnerae TaxID=2426 RepID=UPI00037464CF|nr:hypothetical protein [Teredinibacter turnerae]
MKSLMFFLASVLSLSANSADIQVLPSSEESGFPPSRIIIEGQFVEGDFEKLLSKIFELPSAELPIRWLALNDSAGGDLMEAMKIGELIKELYLQTFVVGDCNSACAFVAMSSQFRVVIGSIGLHRPYFAPKYFKNMTPNQANEKYQQLHRLARSYLEKITFLLKQ